MSFPRPWRHMAETLACASCPSRVSGSHLDSTTTRRRRMSICLAVGAGHPTMPGRDGCAAPPLEPRIPVRWPRGIRPSHARARVAVRTSEATGSAVYNTKQGGGDGVASPVLSRVSGRGPFRAVEATRAPLLTGPPGLLNRPCLPSINIVPHRKPILEGQPQSDEGHHTRRSDRRCPD